MLCELKNHDIYQYLYHNVVNVLNLPNLKNNEIDYQFKLGLSHVLLHESSNTLYLDVMSSSNNILNNNNKDNSSCVSLKYTIL